MLCRFNPYLAPALYLALSFACMPPVNAAATSSSAYEVVRLASDRIMTIVEGAAVYADEEPDRYYRELAGVLDDVVDFSGFARGVMGPYASKSYYKSLSSEGKSVLRGQVQRFTEQIRVGLVRTYGKGLLVFSGSRVEVQRPNEESDESNKSSIIQLIYSDASEPYVIRYQMRRSKDGVWKLRNLIVESINLGQVYRNQFQAAVRDNDGDLDAVINNWIDADLDS
ncbi:MAG: phospholipid-binding protein MlaC [Lysobacterales bacterium]